MKIMKESYISKINKGEYCIGCGLCESMFSEHVTVKLGNDGKYQVIEQKEITEEMDKLFRETCPILKYCFSSEIWGEYKSCYFGSSNDTEIRYKASSGGILTQALVYLLNKKKVDAVLQIGVDYSNPLENVAYISTAEQEIINNCGSRYAPAKLLSQLKAILNQYEKIAIVGKPCDIRALTNYVALYPEYENNIVFKFSFFCGGIPSQNATYRVLDELGVNKESVEKFSYRGNGWPGLTTASLTDGRRVTMTYGQSWGKILGRDIHKYCKFCPDGLGECADFSCGDAWYSAKNGYPDFEENEGRNIVLCRTDKGVHLLEEMLTDGVISMETVSDPNKYLQSIQVGQYFRKTSLFGKALAMRIKQNYVPIPGMRILWNWRGNRNILKQIKVALGTLKRMREGKI